MVGMWDRAGMIPSHPSGKQRSRHCEENNEASGAGWQLSCHEMLRNDKRSMERRDLSPAPFGVKVRNRKLIQICTDDEDFPQYMFR
jgi:hypothetical protein